MIWFRQAPYVSITCRTCGLELGKSIGHKILVGNSVTLRRTVSLECRCGATRKWRPKVDSGLVKVKKSM